jgi:hypothetical protein
VFFYGPSLVNQLLLSNFVSVLCDQCDDLLGQLDSLDKSNSGTKRVFVAKSASLASMNDTEKDKLTKFEANCRVFNHSLNLTKKVLAKTMFTQFVVTIVMCTLAGYAIMSFLISLLWSTPDTYWSKEPLLASIEVFGYCLYVLGQGMILYAIPDIIGHLDTRIKLLTRRLIDFDFKNDKEVFVDIHQPKLFHKAKIGLLHDLQAYKGFPARNWFTINGTCFTKLIKFMSLFLLILFPYKLGELIMIQIVKQNNIIIVS